MLRYWKGYAKRDECVKLSDVAWAQVCFWGVVIRMLSDGPILRPQSKPAPDPILACVCAYVLIQCVSESVLCGTIKGVHHGFRVREERSPNQKLCLIQGRRMCVLRLQGRGA